jgi:hypothetical protein
MDEHPHVQESPAAAPPLSHALLRRALETLYVPRRAPVTFVWGEKWDRFYPHVGEVLGNRPLTYLEFGVYRGKSMQFMAAMFADASARFFGFDSFEGLPENWENLRKKAFSTDGNAPSVSDPRICFVKGYFQNTLPHFLSETSLTGPVLVHFDADLYSSTLFLLTTLWHHVPEYHFIFDEFSSDEAVALHDFHMAYPVEFEFLAALGPEKNRNRPTQLFGHMKRVAYRP